MRIVGIGDSGMFGWNVEQGEDYLSVLRSNLTARANGVSYEVLNLGVPGYNTQIEVESLRSKGLAYASVARMAPLLRLRQPAGRLPTDSPAVRIPVGTPAGMAP